MDITNNQHIEFKIKKVLIVFISSLFGISAYAQTWNIGTPIATNVKATLSNDTLYIRGTGNMFYTTIQPPWHSSRALIKNLVIEDGVTDIGFQAFSDCTNLTSIAIPNSVKKIENRAFSNCSALTSIDIPESVTSIGESVFGLCSALTSIKIPEGITIIEPATFNQCSSLTSIIIPKGVTGIGVSAFNFCNALTSIQIPGSVIDIGNNAFSYCDALTSITISEGVKNIGIMAFASCNNLTSVTIPASVTSVGGGAFMYDENLTSFTSLSPIPQNMAPNDNVFLGVDISSATLTVPCGSLAAYQNAQVWQNFGTIEEMSCDPGVSNVKADFSCPGQVTVTYDLNTDKPTNVTLYYSADGGNTWLTAQSVTGNLTGETFGIGKTIVWDNRADKVRWGNFKLKVEPTPN